MPGTSPAPDHSGDAVAIRRVSSPAGERPGGSQTAHRLRVIPIAAIEDQWRPRGHAQSAIIPPRSWRQFGESPPNVQWLLRFAHQQT
jgi:hypothetical protein